MGSEELEAKLQASLKEEPSSTTGEEGKGEGEPTPKATEPTEDVKTEEKVKSQAVPYERFKEVNDQRRTLADEMKALQDKLSGRDQEFGKLKQVADDREYDSKVVAKINELHADPKYTDIIETLNKAIMGVEVEEETGDLKPEEAAAKKQDALTKANEALGEKLEKTQHDMILDRCDRVIDKFFDQLPEAYNADDKEILKGRLGEKINWETIEQNPDGYVDVLHGAFQEVVDWYKTPKGALIDPEALKALAAKESPEAGKPEPKVEDLLKKDWGKLKDTGRKVKTMSGEVKIMEPEVSDGDFSRILGRMLKERDEG